MKLIASVSPALERGGGEDTFYISSIASLAGESWHKAHFIRQIMQMRI